MRRALESRLVSLALIAIENDICQSLHKNIVNNFVNIKTRKFIF